MKAQFPVLRAQYLGLAIPKETAREFSIKFIISLTVISLATAQMILQEIKPDIWKQPTTSSIIKKKVQRGRRKILDLLINENQD